MREAPACLAVLLSFPEPEAGLGCNAIHQDPCLPNGVAQAGPRSVWCGEMRPVLRLIGVGDPSELGMVAHAFRRPLHDEIKTVEAALSRREDTVAVGREVLGLSLVFSGTEVQGSFEPDAQQGSDMRAAIWANGREPIQLGIRQCNPRLRPLRRCRIRAAEGAQFGDRNWFRHAALRSF